MSFRTVLPIIILTLFACNTQSETADAAAAPDEATSELCAGNFWGGVEVDAASTLHGQGPSTRPVMNGDIGV